MFHFCCRLRWRKRDTKSRRLTPGPDRPGSVGTTDIRRQQKPDSAAWAWPLKRHYHATVIGGHNEVRRKGRI